VLEACVLMPGCVCCSICWQAQPWGACTLTLPPHVRSNHK
jgi:hypothetical protein